MSKEVDFAAVYDEYWSSVTGALTNIATELAKRAEHSSFNKAISKKYEAFALAKQFEQLSEKASNFAEKFDKIKSTSAEYGKKSAAFMADFSKKLAEDAKANRLS